MSSSEALICPTTQEPCMFSNYCTAQKELRDEGGVHPASPLGEIFFQFPPEVREAMDTSHCSTERMRALARLCIDDNLDPRLRSIASDRARGIALGRILFMQ